MLGISSQDLFATPCAAHRNLAKPIEILVRLTVDAGDSALDQVETYIGLLGDCRNSPASPISSSGLETTPSKVEYQLTEEGRRLESVVSVVRDFGSWVKSRSGNA